MDTQLVEMIEKNFARLIREIKTLAEIPTPTGDEVRRAQEVRDQFHQLQLKNISFDEAGNMVVAWPPMPELDLADRPLVLFTAHLDTVYPWEVEWKVRQVGELLFGPGVVDNSTGVGVLIWIAKFLKEMIPEPKNQYILAATVGEGDQLQGIRALIDKFWDGGLNPSQFLHVAIEGNHLGQITCGGVGLRRYEVEITTKGGHSWYDSNKPNAIHVATGIIEKLYNEFKQEPGQASFNVGTIKGGTAINAVASHALFKVEFRASDARKLGKMEKKILTIFDAAGKADGVSLQVTHIGGGDPSILHKDLPVIKILADILKDLKIRPEIGFGFSESNYPLSLGLQSVTLGCTIGSNTHSVNESMETSILKQGIYQFLALIRAIEISFPFGKTLRN